MRDRHNAILERTRKAIPTDTHSTILVDQKIPDSPGQLRPDIVCISNDKIVVVNITVPFESGPEAFHKAKQEKKLKYSDLIDRTKSKYSNVFFRLSSNW